MPQYQELFGGKEVKLVYEKDQNTRIVFDELYEPKSRSRRKIKAVYPESTLNFFKDFIHYPRIFIFMVIINK